MTETEILRVIGYMKEAKTSHERWINNLTTNPDFDSTLVGDTAFHQKWVDRYNETIELLLSFPYLLERTRRGS